MTKWKEGQKAMLRLEPIDLGDDYWMYETPAGFEIYSYSENDRGRCLATIKMNTIFAFIKRWEKAKKGRKGRKPNDGFCIL